MIILLHILTHTLVIMVSISTYYRDLIIFDNNDTECVEMVKKRRASLDTKFNNWMQSQNIPPFPMKYNEYLKLQDSFKFYSEQNPEVLIIFNNSSARLYEYVYKGVWYLSPTFVLPHMVFQE